MNTFIKIILYIILWGVPIMILSLYLSKVSSLLEWFINIILGAYVFTLMLDKTTKIIKKHIK